jgi:hypothetical protein
MPKTTWRPQPAHPHTCTSTRGMILIGLPWPEVNHSGAHSPHISTNGEPYTLTRKAWWSRRSPLLTLGTHLSGPARCIAAAPSFRALFPRLPPSLYRIKPHSPTPRPLRLSNALVCATVTPVTHPAKKKAGTPSRTPAWKRHTTELSCIAIPRRADPLQLHPRVYTPPGSL